MKNIWDYDGHGYLVIPTNLMLNKNNHNVMGAGLAKQAKDKFPDFPRYYGEMIHKYDDVTLFWYQRGCIGDSIKTHGLLAFPTKTDWKDKSGLELIEKCAYNLALRMSPTDGPYYFPRIGTGLGGLNWDDVKIRLVFHLSAQFNDGRCVFLEP